MSKKAIKKNSKFNFGKYGIAAVVLLILVFIGYSLYETFKSGAQDQGLVVCTEDKKCYWQAHIHAYAPIKICGEEYRMPVEKGLLSGPHSHEEKNVIHWHDRIAYDNVNKKIEDLTPFTLGAYFDALDTPFDKEQILDKKNGDKCPNGEEGTLKMFVNGAPNLEYRDFVWKDKDVIVLIFDEQSIEEAESDLRSNPVNFPTVGRE